ncbi:MAG: Ig-like domain-containing protein, partial [Gemmatimonadaceae bacterium]
MAWSSSNTAVATVSEAGLVTPTGFGTTEITASATKVAKAAITVAPATRAIQITPGVDTIFVEDPIALRDTVRLKATAFDDTGAVVTGTKFSWTSSTPAIATVDASGLVTATALGFATITAQSGDRTRSATVRVNPVVKAIQVTASATTVLARDTVQLTAVALGWDDKPMTGRTFKWTSSNISVATIDI